MEPVWRSLDPRINGESRAGQGRNTRRAAGELHETLDGILPPPVHGTVLSSRISYVFRTLEWRAPEAHGVMLTFNQ